MAVISVWHEIPNLKKINHQAQTWLPLRYLRSEACAVARCGPRLLKVCLKSSALQAVEDLKVVLICYNKLKGFEQQLVLLP
ncbi:hypothetical protein O6P43_002103 [Quillaja saponaria]|uniref:Uncharacterized protein n=1 Tax=Quillaja saponaria TaxID=32244 RepID=A0AAD7QBS0_QUISA|nr:hypothetical protein O6P43_002103 [Quillaja saponaria]